VWCAGEVDVLEVYAAAFRSLGYNIGAVIRRLAEIFESAKSRRLCVNSNEAGVTGSVVVRKLFYRFMENVFGGELYKTGSLTRKGIKKFRRVYACIDVEEARAKIRSLMDRLSQIKRTVVPINPTDLIPPSIPTDRRAGPGQPHDPSGQRARRGRRAPMSRPGGTRPLGRGGGQ
ncbi:hypothetical protein, partial [Pyrobaculum sp.]|uniref:hypothetical protein n=1 Tax=Pyrobaculum sp. TaxID=2004705 RepID=UPI003D0CE031